MKNSSYGVPCHIHRNPSRHSSQKTYRKGLLRVEGKAYTLEEIEEIVGCRLSLGKLRSMQSSTKLTFDKIIARFKEGDDD
jgi:hypothetical protein